MNTLVNQIIRNQITCDEMGTNLCRLFLSDEVINDVFNEVDQKALVQLAQTKTKKDLRSAIQFTFGEINFEGVNQFLENWMKINEIKYKQFLKNETIRYVIQHSFGKPWSVYFLATLESVYEDLGYLLKETSASNQCCSFTITVAPVQRSWWPSLPAPGGTAVVLATVVRHRRR